MIETFQKIFHFSEKRTRILWESIIFNIVHSVFDIMQFAALYLALNAVFDDSIKNAGLKSMILVLISIIGRTAMDCGSNLRQTKAGYFMAADKRIHIGNRMRYMPMGFFNKNSLGSLTALVTTLMSDVEYNAPKVLNTVVSGFVYTLVVAAAAIVFCWEAGVIIALGILFYLIIHSLMQKRTRFILPKRQELQRRLVEDVLEYVQGLSVARTFGLDEQSGKKVDVSIDENKDISMKIEKEFIPYMSASELVLRIASVGVVLVSVLLYINGNMDIWKSIVLIIASFYAFSKLETAGTMSSVLRIIDTSIDQIEEADRIEIMDTNGEDVILASHDIVFDNVDFSYGEKQVLNGINLKIPEKSTTAIVGHSGSGKTTLCSLIARFWDVTGGSVSIGGKDVRKMKLDSLLSDISIVFQDVYLFQDTIANNIRFGDPDATDEEVIAAAKKACCHEFISKLPDGYDTVIGEGGATLSGGEKQRISIARAILKDSAIIILDEATSSVDPENEESLQNAIAELTKDKTTIMIAHRLKTVQNADQIVVLENGRIAELGTHEQLLKNSGIYSNFIALREKAGNWKLIEG
jgi:ATP-binding cassette subfamily B protein